MMEAGIPGENPCKPMLVVLWLPASLSRLIYLPFMEQWLDKPLLSNRNMTNIHLSFAGMGTEPKTEKSPNKTCSKVHNLSAGQWPKAYLQSRQCWWGHEISLYMSLNGPVEAWIWTPKTYPRRLDAVTADKGASTEYWMEALNTYMNEIFRFLINVLIHQDTSLLLPTQETRRHGRNNKMKYLVSGSWVMSHWDIWIEWSHL